jgi:hypothetical protein
MNLAGKRKSNAIQPITRYKLMYNINYGDDDVRHKKQVAEPGISDLGALGGAANIGYTPDESATNHHGAKVTAVDGFKSTSIMSGFIMSLEKPIWIETAHVYSRFVADYRGHKNNMAISYIGIYTCSK